MSAEHASQNTFTPIAEIGEFGLIDRIRKVLGEVQQADDLVMGIGDDGAVYRIGRESVHVLTTDLLVEGVHFDRMVTPLEHLGFKAVSVNVSDIAAMNARPRWVTIDLGLPASISVEMVESLYQGVARAAKQYQVTIVGGDTSAARQLIIGVSVVGDEKEEAIVYRKGAKPGDLLCVSGDLGGAYAGLKILMEQKRRYLEEGDAYTPDVSSFAYVIQRHLAPRARIDVVEAWKKSGVKPSSLIDISDGLASEVHHICRASQCGARIHAPSLPIDLQTRQVADLFGEDVDTYALFGGEDYELLCTLSPEQFEQVSEGLLTVIGKITPASEGVKVDTGWGEVVELQPAGYEHFRTPKQP